MKLCTSMQEGCGYKDTLRAHRYFAPSARYFTLCINYQPPLVILVYQDNTTVKKFTDFLHFKPLLRKIRELTKKLKWYKVSLDTKIRNSSTGVLVSP